MAASLVGTVGAIVGGSVSSVTPVIPQASTAGNLLVAWVATQSTTTTTTTTSSGWLLAKRATATSKASVDLWYKPNCGASEANPTFTNTVGPALWAFVCEFSGIQTSPIDQTGSATGTTSPLSVSCSANDTAATDLVVSCIAFGGNFGSGAFTAHGTGWTALRDNGSTGDDVHISGAYQVQTTGGSSPDSDSVGYSGSVIAGVAGVIVSFKAIVIVSFVGASASASTIAGTLSVADSLVGRTDSVSTDAAALTDKVAILATTKSASTVSGALVAPIPLPVVAKAASTSTVSGTLHITDVLQGGLAATSTITDVLSDVDSMGASVQSASADSGTLIAPIPIVYDVRHIYDGVVAPTALAVDYTAWFNGLLMGSGTSFITEKWTGLMGIAPVVQYHTKAQSKHGVFYGYEVQDARTVACDFGIDGNSAADLEAKLSTLAAAMQLPNVFTSELTIPLSTAAIDSPLIIKRPGKPTRQIFCHINKFDVDDDYHLAMGMAKGSIAWYAGDPRVYDLAQSSATAILGGGTNSINMTVTNGGNFPTTRFMLVITGPMAGPLSIQNTSAFGSPQLKLNAVMVGTDTLVIDFFAKTIQLNGVDFYQWKRSDGTWWDLLPGANNLIINRTSNDSAASNISASWFNAWSGMA